MRGLLKNTMKTIDIEWIPFWNIGADTEEEAIAVGWRKQTNGLWAHFHPYAERKSNSMAMATDGLWYEQFEKQQLPIEMQYFDKKGEGWGEQEILVVVKPTMWIVPYATFNTKAITDLANKHGFTFDEAQKRVERWKELIESALDDKNPFSCMDVSINVVSLRVVFENG